MDKNCEKKWEEAEKALEAKGHKEDAIKFAKWAFELGYLHGEHSMKQEVYKYKFKSLKPKESV